VIPHPHHFAGTPSHFWDAVGHHHQRVAVPVPQRIRRVRWYGLIRTMVEMPSCLTNGRSRRQNAGTGDLAGVDQFLVAIGLPPTSRTVVKPRINVRSYPRAPRIAISKMSPVNDYALRHTAIGRVPVHVDQARHERAPANVNHRCEIRNNFLSRNLPNQVPLDERVRTFDQPLIDDIEYANVYN